MLRRPHRMQLAYELYATEHTNSIQLAYELYAKGILIVGTRAQNPRAQEYGQAQSLSGAASYQWSLLDMDSSPVTCGQHVVPGIAAGSHGLQAHWPVSNRPLDEDVLHVVLEDLVHLHFLLQDLSSLQVGLPCEDALEASLDVQGEANASVAHQEDPSKDHVEEHLLRHRLEEQPMEEALKRAHSSHWLERRALQDKLEPHLYWEQETKRREERGEGEERERERERERVIRSNNIRI